MPLPHKPDGNGPEWVRVDHPAPAAASPQAQLLAELWERATELYAYQWADEVPADVRKLKEAEMQGVYGALVGVLRHFYGVPVPEGYARIRKAAREGLDAEALL